MRNKMIRKVVLIGLVVGMLAGGTVLTESASASSWHRGTPKIMRGTWYIPKSEALKVSKSGYGYYSMLYSRKFHSYFVHEASFNFATNAKYRKVSAHKYQVRALIEGGHADGNDLGKYRTRTFTVTKKHLNNGFSKWTKTRPRHMITTKKGMYAFVRGMD